MTVIITMPMYAAELVATVVQITLQGFGRQFVKWFALYAIRPTVCPVCLSVCPVHPQFSTDVYCGQTAAWIKKPLSTKVGVGLLDIVLDGDPAPLPYRGTAPNFRPLSVVAKRLDGLRCLLVWS